MVLAARKDHPAAEGILPLLGDQTDLPEKLQGIAEGAEMRAQVSAARIANAEFLDQGGIVYSALRQVVNAFGMAVQFELIKAGGVFEQCSLTASYSPAASSVTPCTALSIAP
jgi:hypothetical protein